MALESEQADVVVVGGRLAGCALSAPLARAGRKVVVLEKMAFPSDQLSTHLMMPEGVAEFARMGALHNVLAIDPSIVHYVHAEVEGVSCLERMRPSRDGIDFGLCIPRKLQDIRLVQSAREQGVEVREHCTFQSLHWRAGRVEVQSPTVVELFRDGGRTEEPDVSDLFGRARTFQQIFPLPRVARALTCALVSGERPRSETITRAIPELRRELDVRRERFAHHFRETRLIAGSDHPGVTWPAPPTVRPETPRERAKPALVTTTQEVAA
jgi:hypothetical protein